MYCDHCIAWSSYLCELYGSKFKMGLMLNYLINCGEHCPLWVTLSSDKLESSDEVISVYDLNKT